MSHTFVSLLNTIAGDVLFATAQAFWRSPLGFGCEVVAVTLAAGMGLVGLLADRSKPARRQAEIEAFRPLRLRR